MPEDIAVFQFRKFEVSELRRRNFGDEEKRGLVFAVVDVWVKVSKSLNMTYIAPC